MAKIINQELKYSGKFLEFKEIIFKNDDNKELKWESVNRKNNASAVSIVTILKPSNRIVLVKQFRAPVGEYCIENPAGIIEQGETIEESALRELKEETGYIGKIVWTGFPTESSAGMTNEMTIPVLAIVDEELDENKNPKQKLDNTEHIEIIKIPFNELRNQLREFHKKEYCISGRLYSMVIPTIISMYLK